ncbi:MAG: Crp/Fnr family transcriptional regulator [Bacteroidota bacterium]
MTEVKKEYPIRVERFLQGAKIFQEGEQGEKMYVILKGDVELSVRGKVIAGVARGGILGEMALIDAGPRSATACAKSDCELVVIDEERFLALVHEKPSFAIEVMKVLVARLRLMDEVTRGEIGS